MYILMSDFEPYTKYKQLRDELKDSYIELFEEIKKLYDNKHNGQPDITMHLRHNLNAKITVITRSDLVEIDDSYEEKQRHLIDLYEKTIESMKEMNSQANTEIRFYDLYENNINLMISNIESIINLMISNNNTLKKRLGQNTEGGRMSSNKKKSKQKTRKNKQKTRKNKQKTRKNKQNTRKNKQKTRKNKQNTRKNKKKKSLR